MTTEYGHSPRDVRRWPGDPAAHRALADYLRRFPADPDTEFTSELLLNGYGLDFSDADMSGLELLGAEFSRAILTRVSLVGASLYVAWLREAQLSDADLSGAYLRKVQGQYCRARNAKLCGADLQRADFTDTDLRGADLCGALLQRVTFANSDLRQAILRYCTFRTTRLSRARLADSDVRGARGMVIGPIDIGVSVPHFIDGPELLDWFSSHGAPEVVVHQRP